MSFGYAILGDKANFHKMVEMLGFYLPKLDSKCITSNYLFGVIVGKNYGIKKTEIKPHLTELRK